jgi:hypothetical protein
MRDYFTKKKVEMIYVITNENFKNCLKFDLLKNKISELHSSIDKKENLIEK